MIPPLGVWTWPPSDISPLIAARPLTASFPCPRPLDPCSCRSHIVWSYSYNALIIFLSFSYLHSCHMPTILPSYAYDVPIMFKSYLTYSFRLQVPRSSKSFEFELLFLQPHLHPASFSVTSINYLLVSLALRCLGRSPQELSNFVSYINFPHLLFRRSEESETRHIYIAFSARCYLSKHLPRTTNIWQEIHLVK